MYLVLTAMLALNVSAEVLDAFVLIDNGLSRTTNNYRIKNEKLYTQFDNLMLVNPVKVRPWKLKADEIKKQANEIIEFVQDQKIEVVKIAEGPETPAIINGREVESDLIKNKGQLDIGGQVLIGFEGSGKGFELKKKLISFREYLVSLIDPNKGKELIESINGILDTSNPPIKDGKQNSWESYRFENIPVISVIPQLTKVQVDVLNCEAEILNYLLQQVGASDFKFNVLSATIIPNASQIFQGNEFKAEVFLAASDTTQQPIIYICNYDSTYNKETQSYDYNIKGGSETIPVSKNGRGVYARKATSTGPVRWSGLIEMRAPDGSITRKPFRHEYLVSPPSIVVSPTKMNVFYIGVDNPVEISVPGIPTEKLTATISKGSIDKVKDSKGNWSFIVNPARGEKTCEVTVFAEVEGRKKQNMGFRPFRVKPVPTPYPAVIGIPGKTVEKNVLAASMGIEAKMPADFEFELKFKITGFKIGAIVGGFLKSEESKNQLFTEAQKRIINTLRSGNQVTITDITAVGPGGDVVPLYDLVLKIK